MRTDEVTINDIIPDKFGHKTRASDSSLYDEVCTLCGATDGPSDLRLTYECPLTMRPSSVAAKVASAEAKGASTMPTSTKVASAKLASTKASSNKLRGNRPAKPVNLMKLASSMQKHVSHLAHGGYSHPPMHGGDGRVGFMITTEDGSYIEVALRRVEVDEQIAARGGPTIVDGGGRSAAPVLGGSGGVTPPRGGNGFGGGGSAGGGKVFGGGAGPFRG